MLVKEFATELWLEKPVLNGGRVSGRSFISLIFTVGAVFCGRAFGTLTFTDFPSDPATRFTNATQISGGTIVGVTETNLAVCGFTLTNGVYSLYSAPAGDGNSQINGISGTTIVGQYQGNRNEEHGFIQTGDGTFTTLDYPGAADTYALGVSNGTVVGYYYDNTVQRAEHGFVWNNGVFSAVDYPGAANTVLYDVDGTKILGGYYDATGFHGFTEQGGVLTPFSVPGNDLETFPAAISGNIIVGNVIDEDDDGTYGFIDDNGIFTTVLDPEDNDESTVFTGIDGDMIVGNFEPGPTFVIQNFTAVLDDQAVPEPSNLVVMGIGGVFLWGRRRR